MCLLHYFQLLKNFHDEKKLDENELEELYSKYSFLSFLHYFDIFLWARGGCQGTSYISGKRTLYNFISFSATVRKPTWINTLRITLKNSILRL